MFRLNTGESVTFFHIVSVRGDWWPSHCRKRNNFLNLQVLFDVAKFYAPSIVLFEEIDGLTSCRDVYEHESAKRFKNEFLAQIDGLYDKLSNICILGTTNLPWSVNQTMRAPPPPIQIFSLLSGTSTQRSFVDSNKRF